jgi:hypothetical protein
MFPAVCAFFLLICWPHSLLAQSNSLPQPLQKLINNLPSASKTSDVARVDGTANQTSKQTVRSDSAVAQQASKLLKQLEETGKPGVLSTTNAAECAHIAIFKAPDVDPGIVQQISKEFVSNMPKLRGAQTCDGDFDGGVMVKQGKPVDGDGRFLPITRKPEYRILP